MNISISRDGVEIGEWPESVVRTLYLEGSLLGTDYFWREGMEEWKPLLSLVKSSPTTSKDAYSLTPPSSPNEPEAETTPAIKSPIRLNPTLVQAMGLLAALVGMVGGKAAVQAYPDAGKLVFFGVICGLFIGLIPYCIARFAYKSKQFTLYLWIGAAIGGVAGFAYWPFYFNDQLAAFIHKMNKTLPEMISSGIRADSVTLEPGRVVRSHYTLINAPYSLDPVEFKNAARPPLVQQYRTGPDMSFFRDNKISVIYDFYFETGALFQSEEIDPEDLK